MRTLFGKIADVKNYMTQTVENKKAHSFRGNLNFARTTRIPAIGTGDTGAVEYQRSGYPNMTRSNAAGSLPLGAEILIYSYLVCPRSLVASFRAASEVLRATRFRSFSPNRDIGLSLSIIGEFV